MRTKKVEIDESLMKHAFDVSGLPTERAAVEEALRLLIRLNDQAATVREMFGAFPDMENDLDLSRLGRKF
jgi:Arc/MetJ family transcription regulator